MRLARGLEKLTAAAIAIGLLLTIVATPWDAGAEPSFQDGPFSVPNKWCEFGLDTDGDGEPDIPFDPDSGSLLPQETEVVGKCYFTIETTIDSTIEIGSGLSDWRAPLRITQEPSPPGEVVVDDTAHPGNRLFEIGKGGMVATVDIRGQSPRGEGLADLPQGYQHQTQIVETFLLLEITAITSAGHLERVASHEASSASNASIRAHDNLPGLLEDASPAVDALSYELLDEGYPAIAERVAGLPPEPDGGSPVWMWIAIIMIALIALEPILKTGNHLYVRHEISCL